MTTPLPLVGDPERVAELVRGMRLRAELFGEVSAIASGAGPGTAWEGPAAEAFAGRLGALAATLRRVRDRYAAAARALELFATEFGELFAAMNSAFDDFTVAEGERSLLQGEMSTVPPEDPAAVTARYLAARDRAQEATARWVAARDRFDQLDAGAAGGLEALAADGLDDHGLYAVVSGIETAGHRVGLLSLAGRWFPVVGAVGLVADVAASLAATSRAVFWDEGDTGDLALMWAGTALGGLGAVTKGASLLTRAGPVTTGLREGAQWAARTRLTDFALKATTLRAVKPVGSVNPPLSLPARAVAPVRRNVEAMERAWTQAGTAGPSARPLLVTSWTANGLSQAEVARERIAKAGDAVDRYLEEDSDPLADRAVAR